MPFEEPEFPRSRVVGRLEQRALGVAGHKDGRQSKLVNEFQRPLRERSPREVAAKDDNVGLRVSDLGEDRFESNRISVDIRDYGDAVSGKRVGHANKTVRIRRVQREIRAGANLAMKLRGMCFSLVSSLFGPPARLRSCRPRSPRRAAQDLDDHPEVALGGEVHDL